MSDDSREVSERAIIGALLNDPASTMPAIEDRGMRSDWFLEDAHAAIFEAALRIYRDGRLDSHDGFTLIMEAKKLAASDDWRKTKRTGGWLDVEGYQEYIIKAQEAAARPGAIESHVQTIRGKHFTQTLSKAFYAAMKCVDPTQAFSMLQSKLNDVMTAMADKSHSLKQSVCDDIFAREQEAWKMRVDPEGPRNLKWIPGFSTPWYMLTRQLFGIAPRLHIWAARPSVGKTSLAVNFMRFWADTGVKVVFNSLDMPAEDLIDRLRIEKSRVSLSKKIFTPTRDDLKRLASAGEYVVKSTVDVVEHSYVEDFCMDIVRLKRAGKCDIAMVDYVQLLNSYNVNNANEYERVSYVAKKLKECANHYKIPIIALCQLNRASTKSDNSEPGLADLRGSGELEQCASTVLILHRDQGVCNYMQTVPFWWFYENRQYGEKIASVSIDAIWLIVAKNQNGRCGRLPFVVNKPYFTWKLADFTASPEEREEGNGFGKHVVKDFKASFMRFHRDWRADSWEESLSRATVPFAVNGQTNLPVLMDEPLPTAEAKPAPAPEKPEEDPELL